MKTLTWFLLLSLIFLGVITHILKKYGVSQVQKFSFDKLLNISFWMEIMTNPYIILTLAFGFIIWTVTLWLFQLEPLSRVVPMLYGCGIITFLIVVLISKMLFGETLNPIQTTGLILLVVSGVIASIGIYYLGCD